MEKEDYASAASLQAELRGIETQPPRPWHNGTPSGGGGLAGLCMLAVSAVAEGGERGAELGRRHRQMTERRARAWSAQAGSRGGERGGGHATARWRMMRLKLLQLLLHGRRRPQRW